MRSTLKVIGSVPAGQARSIMSSKLRASSVVTELTPQASASHCTERVLVGGMKGTTYVQIIKAVLLMTGSALIVDYVLTIAISVASGADAVFSLVATGGGGVTQPPVCGNAIRESGEACDGNDLGGQTCQSQGFAGGSLSCNGDCTLNTSGCTACLAAGASCTANSQCCSNSCKGRNGAKTCR